MEILCFSSNVRQCNITHSVVHVQLCFYIFSIYSNISFVPARVAANSVILKRVCASGWFVLPLGLCEWKLINVRSIPTFTLKNVLRTFEAEIRKIFKNIQPHPKN